MDFPIVCTLTEAERIERQRTILDPIKDSAIESEELPDGYAYSFAASSELLTQLSRLVELERQCCPFLTFRIVVKPDNQPMWLEILGPPPAKPIIVDFFGEPKAAPKSKVEPSSKFGCAVVFESTITCPSCGHAESVLMPVDQCVFFYECKSCQARLRPKTGDCCVFCSYGSVACPNVQQRTLKSE